VPGHFYIGSTGNIRQRLRQHQVNVDARAGEIPSLEAQDLPGIREQETAVRFEIISNPAPVGNFVSVTSINPQESCAVERAH
jgi:hypothetical protein